MQTLLFLTLAVSSAEALYKPGNFLIILISVLLPACVLIGFCGVAVFLCKNRQRIPLLRSKFGGGHERIPHSSSPAQAPTPMMPPPQSPPQSPPSAPPAEKADDAVQPLQQ